MNTTGDVTKTTFMKEVEADKIREEFEVKPLTQTLVFDAAIVTGNDFDLDINGVAITQVPFNVNNNDTVDDIATEIANNADVSSAVRVGTDTVEITPVDGINGVDLDNYIITSGATQAVVVAAKIDSRVRPGMPVEINPATGKIIPLANDGNLEYIGVSLHTSKGGELVTVAMRGYAVIFAHASETLNPGPVNWDSYDEPNGVNEYNQTAVTAITFQGWALDGGDAGDVIRVVVRN